MWNSLLGFKEDMKHLWFDPGLTTGWAMFEDDKPYAMGTLMYGPDLFNWLRDTLLAYHNFDLIGYENYRIRPKGMKQGYTPVGDEVWSVRVIGAIEFAASVRNPDQQMCSQEPDIKPAGYGYAGLGKYDPNKKGMHMQDAIAHGAFYYMENFIKVKRGTQR
jgi:hypothetical protein